METDANWCIRPLPTSDARSKSSHSEDVERVWGSNPIVRNILTLVGNNTSAIYVYVCEPLPDGQDHIDILLDNLRSSSADPSSLTFEDIIVSWFPDLLLGSNQATDHTGVDNQIFQA